MVVRRERWNLIFVGVDQNRLCAIFFWITKIFKFKRLTDRSDLWERLLSYDCARFCYDFRFFFVVSRRSPPPSSGYYVVVVVSGLSAALRGNSLLVHKSLEENAWLLVKARRIRRVSDVVTFAPVPTQHLLPRLQWWIENPCSCGKKCMHKVDILHNAVLCVYIIAKEWNRNRVN